MIAITIEHLTFDAPMVVDEVGIIEIDTPAFALWRKTAKKQYFGTLGQERNEWMVLYPTLAAQDILSIQITLHILITYLLVLLRVWPWRQ